MRPIQLTKGEAETIIRALSAHAPDEMRYAAWDILDAKIKEATQPCAHGVTNPNCTHYS